MGSADFYGNKEAPRVAIFRRRERPGIAAAAGDSRGGPPAASPARRCAACGPGCPPASGRMRRGATPPGRQQAWFSIRGAPRPVAAPRRHTTPALRACPIVPSEPLGPAPWPVVAVKLRRTIDNWNPADRSTGRQSCAATTKWAAERHVIAVSPPPSSRSSRGWCPAVATPRPSSHRTRTPRQRPSAATRRTWSDASTRPPGSRSRPSPRPTAGWHRPPGSAPGGRHRRERPGLQPRPPGHGGHRHARPAVRGHARPARDVQHQQNPPVLGPWGSDLHDPGVHERARLHHPGPPDPRGRRRLG